VSKFHSIWSTITRESNLGRMGWILGENQVFQRPLTGQCPALLDNIQCDLDKEHPSVFSFRNSQSENVRLYRKMSGPTGQCPTETFSPMFVHDFGHILLTGCPIGPILFLLHL
jgi:hypothetical protein